MYKCLKSLQLWILPEANVTGIFNLEALYSSLNKEDYASKWITTYEKFAVFRSWLLFLNAALQLHNLSENLWEHERHVRCMNATLEQFCLLFFAHSHSRQSLIVIVLEIECGVGRLLQTQVTTIRPKGTSGLRETCCWKGWSLKTPSRLLFLSVCMCVFTRLQCPREHWNIDRLLHPHCITQSQHTEGSTGLCVGPFRSYSQCQCGGQDSGHTQRCQCLATWYWCKTEERWVDPWWFGWPLACMETASLTAGRRYSRIHPSPCLHAAWKGQTEISQSDRSQILMLLLLL